MPMVAAITKVHVVAGGHLLHGDPLGTGMVAGAAGCWRSRPSPGWNSCICACSRLHVGSLQRAQPHGTRRGMPARCPGSADRWSLLNPIRLASSCPYTQYSLIIDEGYGQYKRIQPVQHPAMAWQEAARVLGASGAFQSVTRSGRRFGPPRPLRLRYPGLPRRAGPPRKAGPGRQPRRLPPRYRGRGSLPTAPSHVFPGLMFGAIRCRPMGATRKEGPGVGGEGGQQGEQQPFPAGQVRDIPERHGVGHQKARIYRSKDKSQTVTPVLKVATKVQRAAPMAPPPSAMYRGRGNSAMFHT